MRLEEIIQQVKTPEGRTFWAALDSLPTPELEELLEEIEQMPDLRTAAERDWARISVLLILESRTDVDPAVFERVDKRIERDGASHVIMKNGPHSS